MKSFNEHWKYKALPYTVSYPELFHGNKTKTGTNWAVITIDRLLNSRQHKQPVRVEFFKDSHYTFILVIDGQQLGTFDKPGNLTYYFDEETAMRLYHTVCEGKGEITRKEQHAVHVFKPWLDDPNFKAIRDADNAYWKSHGVKFGVWLDNEATTKTAFYVKTLQSDGTELHTKLRISNIKNKSTNVDESHFAVNPETGEALGPEQYVKTHNIKNDDLARWFIYDWHVRMTDTNPTSAHFK